MSAALPPHTPPPHRLSVAPMMDWTDRHCRVFHRTLTRRTLLYTEMVTAPAILHGDRDRLLGFDPAEQPVALQIGGSDPREVGEGERDHRWPPTLFSRARLSSTRSSKGWTTPSIS